MRASLRTTLQLITGLSLLAVNAAPAFANFSGAGDGSAATPFLVSTCSQLQDLRNQGTGNQLPGSVYKLSTNINCTGVAFVPVTESGGAGWTGELDGANFAISNLTVNAAGGAGLFGTLDQTASIHDLSITNASVTGGDDVGILAGDGEGIITNVSVSGTVNGHSSVGGLIGFSSTSLNIFSCSSTANVNGSLSDGRDIGGLVGVLTPTSDPTINPGGPPVFQLNNSYATGNVGGNIEVGGLIGNLDAHVAVTNCYATGTVTATSGTAGGLIGIGDAAEVDNSFATGFVNGTVILGGFIGYVKLYPPPYSVLHFQNDFFGASSQQTACAGFQEPGVTVTCQEIDNVSAQPGYFLGNLTNPPMSVWDHNIWSAVSGETPELKNGAPVPTATPTPIGSGPTPIPTSTPTRAPGTTATPSASTTLSGTVNPPTANAIVYLYSNGVVIGSTLTDANGNFSFQGTPGVIYSAIPHKTGAAFTPPSFTLTTGAPAIISANSVDLKDAGCSVKNTASKLTATDSVTGSLHALVFTTGGYVAAHVPANNQAKVTAAAKKVISSSDKAFTSALNSSKALPTEVLSCPAKLKKCRLVSYSSKISAYRVKLNTLLNEVLSLDSTLRSTVKSQAHFASTNDQKARRLYSQALAKLTKVPASGKQCR